MPTGIPLDGPRRLGRAGVDEPQPLTGPETDDLPAPQPAPDHGPFADVRAQLRADAATGRELAAQKRAAIKTADDDLAATRQRLEAEHAEQVRILGAEADGAEEDAHSLEERARLMDRADFLRDQAEHAERGAAAIAAEGERAAAELAAVREELAGYVADRQETETRQAEARTARNATGVTEAKLRLGTLADFITDAEAAQEAASAHVRRIGDDDTGQLADALAAARALRVDLWQVLCTLTEDESQPGHAEAVQARDAEAEGAAAYLARLCDRLQATITGARALLDRLRADREELGRRRQIPVVFRTLDSSVRLSMRIEGLDGYIQRLGGAVSAVADALEQIGGAGPADVERMTVLARQRREHLLDLTEPGPRPLEPDDIGDPLSNLGANAALIARAEAEERQKPAPAIPARRIVRPGPQGR